MHFQRKNTTDERALDAMSRKSILIVEDEPLVALELHRILSEAGASLISAANPAEARKLISYADISAAIVDVQLGREDSAQVCRLLARRGIPFAFYTGNVHAALLAHWPDVPVLKKPAKAEDIVAVMRSMRATELAP